MSTDQDWWRDAVVYQVYIRSFADGNGDGIGDIAGIRSRLPYLRDLGVDALWINPWYPSPMADGGYDVADYRSVAPMFGTFDQATAMIEEAHGHGLRVILDLVPNHTSWVHPWFREALDSPPGSDERRRYYFRAGRGAGGELPPNDWVSTFGGPAWTRVADGQWYLHLFDSSQPDLNWAEESVRDEFASILRFWFDLGVDGFRIDVAHGLAKHPDLPDLGEPMPVAGAPGHPHWDVDDVHEIYRSWRRIADSYPEPKVFVGEVFMFDVPHRLARYLRPDELHSAFNLDFLHAVWEQTGLRNTITESMAAVSSVGAPVTWVLSNHDVARHVSRLGRPLNPGAHLLSQLSPIETLDRELGRRRARAMALLAFALPGNAYIYQGDELGLWEVEDIPEEALQDPTWRRSGHTDRGRDGCRVPLPWSGTESPFGFAAEGTRPWLPQPADFAQVTVAEQDGDPGSILALYRAALALRRKLFARGDASFAWLPGPPGVLAFERGPGFHCWVNLATEPAPLPADAEVLLASVPLTPAGELPPDAAAWLRPGPLPDVSEQ